MKHAALTLLNYFYSSKMNECEIHLGLKNLFSFKFKGFNLDELPKIACEASYLHLLHKILFDFFRI